MPDFLTLEEVSELFREDRQTTRRRVARGDLPAVVLPDSRRLLFARSDVLALAQAHRSDRRDRSIIR